MKVIATKQAFIGGSRVRVGQAVEVPDGTKGNWFVLPEKAGKVGKADKAPRAETPSTLSAIAKEAPQGPTDSIA